MAKQRSATTQITGKARGPWKQVLAQGITRAHANLGGTVAEQEHHLESLYIGNHHLDAALDHADHRCFLIGRTGCGKSAILKMVASRNSPSNVLTLTASDFAFKDVELSRGIETLSGLGGNLAYLFRTIWKYLLVVALLKRRYPDLRDRKGVLQELYLSLTNSKKQRAYDFLRRNEEIYGERSFADRLSDMVERIDKSVAAKLSVKGLSLRPTGVAVEEVVLTGDATFDGASAKEGVRPRSERRTQLGQEIANLVEREWDTVGLTQVVELLQSDFLEGHRYWVLIDDLDKTFAGSALSASFITALFEVIMEMSHLSSIRFLVALRTNIFSSLRFYQSPDSDDPPEGAPELVS